MKAASFVFFTLALLALIGEVSGVPALIAPFGATAVILFEFPKGPFSTARSYLGGHLVAALVGSACHELIPNLPLAIGAAGGFALFFMRLTRTVHPAAGATPLVIILTQQSPSFLVYPLGLGLVLIFLIFEVYRRFVLRT